MSKDGNIVPVLEAIAHKTEVVVQGEEITVSYWPRTYQIRRYLPISLFYLTFSAKKGLVYTVVLTCVVGVAGIITFSVAGRLTSQVGALHAIM